MLYVKTVKRFASSCGLTGTTAVAVAADDDDEEDEDEKDDVEDAVVEEGG